MNYTIAEIEKDYNLELEKVISEIKKQRAKTVLLQFPDGLKPWGLAISDYISGKTSVKVSIWLGDCFGACDLPKTSCDLVVQFGHAPWR